MFSNSLASRTFSFILAGGQGNRLHPLTRHRAKPVVPFGGVHRLIDFTISNCLNSGLTRIRILTQHHCESLHAYVRALTDGGQIVNDGDCSISCLCPVTGKRYRGTADAVFQNLPILKNAGADFVVILSGDHVYKMDYRHLLRFHANRKTDVTIGAVEYPRHAATRFGVLQIDADGYATSFEEKPNNPKPISEKSAQALVSMGIYIFDARALSDALLEDAERNTTHDFAKDILPRFIRNRRISVYNLSERGTRLGSYWRDVGTLDNYYTASMELLMTAFLDTYDRAGWPMWGAGARHASAHSTFVQSAEIADSLVPEDVSIAPRSRVFHSVLSPRVRIESAATVQNSILFHNVQVGAGAQIHRAILDENVRVADGARIGFDLSHDREYAHVTDSGIVVVPANVCVWRSQNSAPPPSNWNDFVPEDPFKTRQYSS